MGWVSIFLRRANRGLLYLFLPILLLIPTTSYAGILSDIVKFFAGSGAKPESKANPPSSAGYTYNQSRLYADALTLPLLGSGNTLPSGIGGIKDKNSGESPLMTVQDSALVAPRNPIGTFPEAGQNAIVVYTVQPGDIPSRIAADFGISLNTLLWANDIKNPNLIKAGDELVILPVSGVQYTIRKGDTLESIAKRFKGDVVDILNYNGLALGKPLVPGESIIIPNGEVYNSPTERVRRTKYTYSSAKFAVSKGYYIRPIKGGVRTQGIHGYNAVDLANSCGLPVYASASGNIIVAKSKGWNGGYGKYIVVSHPNGTQTLYAHLSKILVSRGQYVLQGKAIGLIGSTGNSTGCHVHFEIRNGIRNPF